MFESNNDKAHEAVVHTAETSAFYLAELERVTEERDQARESNNALRHELDRRSVIIDKVTARIQQEFDNGGWLDDDPFLLDLDELLPGLVLTEETEIEIVARWSVTVTHPKGMNLSDISVDVDEPRLDGDACSFGWVSHDETEINEL